MKQPDYHLTIRIEPGHQGKPDIRLRLALKELLRRFGIRAVSIMPHTTETDDVKPSEGET